MRSINSLGNHGDPVFRCWADPLMFHTLLYRARQRKGLRVFALGQRLRRFADHVATTAGIANGACAALVSRQKAG